MFWYDGAIATVLEASDVGKLVEVTVAAAWGTVILWVIASVVVLIVERAAFRV